MALVAPIERVIVESAAAVDCSPLTPVIESCGANSRRFSNLRGIRWRIDLGILPSTSSVEDLRLTTADYRRRYARLRRHLLVVVNPHEGINESFEQVIDDPLSQNPDSRWGQFFQTAELERKLAQDLSCLCQDEHDSYLHNAGCQSMLRRILLLWCLRHPDCGYRQGMLELLPPLLHVLQVDRDYISKTRKHYEDQFISNNFTVCKLLHQDFRDESKEFPTWKFTNLKELDPSIQELVSLTDAYGPEGELGVVISSLKYLEHDVYSMFEALMETTTMDFFSPSVIKSYSTWYQLLSIIDTTLFNHLMNLHVEPQYFALRWLRVLFRREFSMENILIIWDNIFEHDKYNHNRVDFISCLAVAMMVYIRPSLLASENTTSCLQKLLSFSNDGICLRKLLDMAKSLLALEPFCGELSGSVSPTSPFCFENERYWEGKWRVVVDNGEDDTKKKGWLENLKWRLW